MAFDVLFFLGIQQLNVSNADVAFVRGFSGATSQACSIKDVDTLSAMAIKLWTYGRSVVALRLYDDRTAWEQISSIELDTGSDSSNRRSGLFSRKRKLSL